MRLSCAVGTQRMAGRGLALVGSRIGGAVANDALPFAFLSAVRPTAPLHVHRSVTLHFHQRHVLQQFMHRLMLRIEQRERHERRDRRQRAIPRMRNEASASPRDVPRAAEKHVMQTLIAMLGERAGTGTNLDQPLWMRPFVEDWRATRRVLRQLKGARPVSAAAAPVRMTVVQLGRYGADVPALPSLAYRQSAHARRVSVEREIERIEHTVQTKVVREILQQRQSQQQLRTAVADALLSPKLVQSLARQIHATLEVRASVERYRKGAR
ncbi:hypothetical protein D7S89_15840 [Trinickia fusca]|uniref:Uncharacterized protein n=2 Tax=Trinickia fusca TaxID=2419777 RepID=A0A494XH12_9BURK|nr:hypothetical protein D7S89_15840 [Trinickia fusca]